MTTQTDKLTLPELLREWQSADADVHAAEVERHAVEQLIWRAMAEGKATFAKAPGVEATLKPTLEYQKTLDGPLRVLAEEMSPEEFERLLTAPKPPPERSFHMVQVKKKAREGGIYKTALDAATVTLPATLKVRAVKT